MLPICRISYPMPYEVLALKYRPKVFEDLIGQEPVTRTLANAIKKDRIANAFLFSGVRGVGKTTTARILAKSLNCKNGPTVSPCSECSACTEIAGSSSLDVLEIDGASNNGVDQVRELVDGSRYAPSRDRFKIYIIDEVHMLTTPAFNALLKTLEEPPENVKFIFATTEHHKIPETILSRCQEFEFRTVAVSKIISQLKMIASQEDVEISESALRLIAQTAGGSLRDGISAMDQVIAATESIIEENDVTELLGLIERDVLRKTVQALIERDTAQILTIVEELARSGRDFRFFSAALMQFLRDILVIKVSPDATELVDLPSEVSELKELSEKLSEEDLLRALDVLAQTEGSLRRSSEPRFHLELSLLKLSQLQRLASFEELLDRFNSMTSGTISSASNSETLADRIDDPGVSKKKSSKQLTAHKGLKNLRVEGKTDSSHDRTKALSELASSSGFNEKLLEQLKREKLMLHGLLKQSAWVKLEGNRLKVAYLSTQNTLAEQFKDKTLNNLLEVQASSLAGRKVLVEIQILDTEPIEIAEKPEAISPPTAADTLRKKVEQDPMVRRFKDTFQGDIDSVQSSSTE